MTELTEDQLEAEIWRQLIALAERAQPTLTKYTVCIYVWQEKIKRLAVVGTGVLLRVGGKRFLVSSAHVLDHGFIHKMPLVAQPNKDPEPPIQLDFVVCHSSVAPPNVDLHDRDLRDDDPLDISIAELTDTTADKLAARHSFLTLNDIDPNPPQKADGICVFGYPEKLAKVGQGDIEIENWPFGYATTPLQTEPQPRDKNKDILLYYYNEGTDAKGERSSTPHPKGLSGGGIWRLSRAPTYPAQASLEAMRLVGIQHRYRSKSNYIVGTSAKRLLDMLWSAYPELQPSLKLWRRF